MSLDTTHKQIVDLGCGNNKTPGTFGVDLYPYPGVDQVANLDHYPWPLDTNRFDELISNHFIEHVADILAFMGEIHRITKPGGLVRLTTPHYSSVNSWSDPTHLRHLSAQWYKPFLKDGYIGMRGQAFQLVSSQVFFGKSLRSYFPKLVTKLMGVERWEKHYAFQYPAQDLTTVLRVVKP